VALNPLSQFTIHEVYSTELFGQTIQFTNQALSMLVAISGVIIIFVMGARKQEMVPGRLQSFVEFTYEFIHNTVKENAGNAGLKFLPLIMTLFLYIAGLNLFGLIPHTFTATSQFALNGVMAFSVFGFVLLVGFWKHGLKFLKIFWPADTPFFLALFIAPLEMISFFARPFTLAIRLTANMLAGHILVKVFASFIIMLGLAGIFPFAALMVISCLELLVALLQAYVFAVLTCVYLNDALHLH
jgi:F-type H+-transporting ATPase subunit a